MIIFFLIIIYHKIMRNIIVVYLSCILYISIISSSLYLLYLNYNKFNYIILFFIIYLLIIDIIILKFDYNKKIKALKIDNEIYMYTNNNLIEKNKKLIDILWENINKEKFNTINNNSSDSDSDNNTIKKTNSCESFFKKSNNKSFSL